jgi:hypothetical protein
MQHAGGASRVSRLRRRGGGTLATTRPRSPDGDVAVAAIVHSWVLEISSNVQAHPLPWLAYFGLGAAHSLV